VPRLPLLVAVLSLLIVAVSATAAPPTGEDQGAGAGETIVTGRPPPPVVVQASPGQPTPLPCNLAGGLNDGRNYLNATRPLRAVMLFVDFSDAPGDATTPQELFEGFVPQTEAAMKELSHGMFQPTITPLLKWVRMPRQLAQYGFSSERVGYDKHHDFIDEAIKASDPDVDFSQYSAVYVVGAPTAANIPSAAEGGSARGEGFRADGEEISNAATLGSQDAYHRDFTVLVHETGHLLGLPDLYSYDADDPPFVGAWDVMSVLTPHTPMVAWTRLQVRWLGKSDFVCARKSRTTLLTPVASRGGLKALAVAASPRKAYVVEARTDPVEEACRRDGVLVYRVNTKRSIAYGGGPIRVVDAASDDPSCGDHSRATFIPEDASRYRSPDGRFGIHVLERRGDGYRVRVTVKSCAVPDLFGLTLKRARARLRAGQCVLGKVTGRGKVKAQRPAARVVKDPGARVALTLR